MERSLKDKLLRVTQALPAAAASNATAAIALGAKPYPTIETIQARLTVEDLPALVDEKEAVFTFEDSADGSSFAAIPELAPLTLEGVSTDGADGAVRNVYLPPSVRGHLRVSAAVETGGGNNTGASYTLELIF